MSQTNINKNNYQPQNKHNMNLHDIYSRKPQLANCDKQQPAVKPEQTTQTLKNDHNQLRITANRHSNRQA